MKNPYFYQPPSYASITCYVCSCSMFQFQVPCFMCLLCSTPSRTHTQLVISTSKSNVTYYSKYWCTIYIKVFFDLTNFYNYVHFFIFARFTCCGLKFLSLSTGSGRMWSQYDVCSYIYIDVFMMYTFKNNDFLP